MLTVAFGEFALSKKPVYKWYKLFTESREDVNDNTCSGCLNFSTTAEHVKAVKKIGIEKCLITFREVERISVGSCYVIFSDVLGINVWLRSLYRNC